MKKLQLQKLEVKIPRLNRLVLYLKNMTNYNNIENLHYINNGLHRFSI